MSDTPRTECYVLNPLPQVVSAEWARQLERELNAANQRIERLEKAGDKIVEAGWSVQDWSGMCVVWAKAKEAKP